MARSLALLEPTFRQKIDTLILNCADAGVELLPFYTLRTPIEQARLWRQSRTRQEILKKIDALRAEGATYLADVIDMAGPQYGRWATNALPGYSWHNWGLAVDCAPIRDGELIWDASHADYDTYSNEAIALGLSSGHKWKQKDSVHVQLSAREVPDVFSLKEVNDKMLARFGPI